MRRSDTLLRAEFDAGCGLSERRAQLLEVELPFTIERRCDRHADRVLRALPDAHGAIAAGEFSRRGMPRRGQPIPRFRIARQATIWWCCRNGCSRPIQRNAPQWARDSYDALKPWMSSGRYVNYMGDDEAGDQAAAAYGVNYPRLQKIKAKYDPDNILPYEPEHPARVRLASY